MGRTMEIDAVEFEDCTVVRETDLALLVKGEFGEHWFPKSVILDDSEVYAEDTTGTLVVKAWFAKKDGLT